MDNPTQRLACFACNVPMDRHRTLQLLVKSPDDREYYHYRLKRYIAHQNGQRACVYADCRNIQVQMINDRLSLCGWCLRQACMSCSVPEHPGESCQEHQARVTTEHSQEEAATALALAEGYSAREKVGEQGRVTSRPKRPLPCPSCGIWIERFGGCLRLRCPVCSLDFCGECAAPYLGRNSVPLKGNKAHQPTCHYAKRKVEDRRFRPALSMPQEPEIVGRQDDENESNGGVKEEPNSCA